MSLSTQVLAGLVLGVATGVFFGEYAAILQTGGDVFIMLLQMTVLPYLTVSLIAGLGGLDREQARAILRGGGGALVLLWAVSMAVVIAVPLAFPSWESAAFFSTSLVEVPEPIDLLRLYIPANPFYSLSNSLVPAVVLFSISMGLALMTMPGKAPIVRSLETIAEALMKVTGFIARLAPYGVFALTASAAGTMQLDDLGRIQIYLVTYITLALLLALWVLPGLVAALTPLSARDVRRRARGPLITAFATANLLIVLPILIEESKQMIADGTGTDHDSLSSVDVLVPASYNFPSAGKLLSLSFVPFAAWFVGSDIGPSQLPGFAATGFVSFFGQTVTAVPFLLHYMHLPGDMFYLFATVDVVASRFGVLLAGVHTIAIALIGACAVNGKLTLSWRRLGRFVLISLAVILLTIGALRLIFELTMHNDYRRDEVVKNMHLMRERAPAVVYRETPDEPRPMADSPALERIRTTGMLRVGYVAGNLPYSYFNSAGELAGFDIELAHKLAGDIGATLEFVPVEPDVDLAGPLDSGYCDIVMGGIEVTIERAERVAFSKPYITETLALLVPDYARNRFRGKNRGDLASELDSMRIAVRNEPYYQRVVERLAPHAEVTAVDSFEEYFDAEPGRFDVLVTTAETGSAWSLLYPDYSVIVSPRNTLRVPLAYPVSMKSERFLRLLDTWIDLKREDATIEDAREYWIMGHNAEQRAPRWSVIRNVLGWVD